jgi:phospholipase/carboxylesterase/glyoxalase family protein
MKEADIGFIHRFVPAQSSLLPTVLVLHGTGGDENDLLPLGKNLAPGAALLSPRGKILENGMPRFFRRLAMGVFDEQDLRFRTQELAAFVRSSSDRYGFDAGNVVAVGYSNGANIAASMLLLHPQVLRAAVLFSPMVPLKPDQMPDLKGAAVFVAAGQADPIVPPENTKQLVSLLERAGAEVTEQWHRGGHELSQSIVAAARHWLSQLFERFLQDNSRSGDHV